MEIYKRELVKKHLEHKGKMFGLSVMSFHETGNLSGSVLIAISELMEAYVKHQKEEKEEVFTKADMIAFGRECRSPRNTNVKESILFQEWKVLN